MGPKQVFDRFFAGAPYKMESFRGALYRYKALKSQGRLAIEQNDDTGGDDENEDEQDEMLQPMRLFNAGAPSVIYSGGGVAAGDNEQLMATSVFGSAGTLVTPSMSGNGDRMLQFVPPHAKCTYNYFTGCKVAQKLLIAVQLPGPEYRVRIIPGGKQGVLEAAMDTVFNDPRHLLSESFGASRPELFESTTAFVRVLQSMRSLTSDTIWWRWEFDLDFQVVEDIASMEAKQSPSGAFLLLLEFEALQSCRTNCVPKKEFSKMKVPPGTPAGT
jgi:hypothetical protein